MLPLLEEKAAEWDLESSVEFAGWLPRTELPRVLRECHFMILPTAASEGFPKVLAEGMAYGVVPIAGAISAIPQILGQGGAGAAIDPRDEQGFVVAVREFVLDAESWERAKGKGLQTARLFSYDAYLNDVIELFETRFGVELPETRLTEVQPR